MFVQNGNVWLHQIDVRNYIRPLLTFFRWHINFTKHGTEIRTQNLFISVNSIVYINKYHILQFNWIIYSRPSNKCYASQHILSGSKSMSIWSNLSQNILNDLSSHQCTSYHTMKGTNFNIVQRKTMTTI